MKTMYKVLLSFGLVACIISAAYAQFAKPEDAITYRKAVMTLIGHHFKQVAAVVKGQQPYDRNDVARNATLVEVFSKLPWDAFMVPDSDKGATQLNPDAFGQRSKFMEAGRELETEATKLVSAANSGNLDAIKNQFGAVAKSCQNCHKPFRTR